MRRLVEHAGRDPRPAHPIRWVEHAQLEARQEQAFDRRVDLLLGDQPLLGRVDQVRVDVAAFQIGAGLHGQGRRLGCGRYYPVTSIDVVDGAAVGHDVAREAPLAPQDVLEQHVAAARRLAVDPVVGAHQRIRPALPDADLEVRQIALAQVALAHHGVERVPFRLGTRVHREMLHGGHGLQVLRVVALHAPDELHRESSREERVFAVGLLAPPPAWIAEQIDVGGPEGQALVALTRARAHVLVVLGAGLVRDNGGHPEHQGVVPGGGETDGLGKRGREPRAGDAVQRFVPPVVLRDSQPLDRRCDVLHLRHFLLERQAGHEIVHAPPERQVRFQVVGRLRSETGADRAPHQQQHGKPTVTWGLHG